jgi:hypothetical protein
MMSPERLMEFLRSQAAGRGLQLAEADFQTIHRDLMWIEERLALGRRPELGVIEPSYCFVPWKDFET